MAKKTTAYNDNAVYDALAAVVRALESGEYLRGDKSSKSLGKSWDNAPYLADLRAALAQIAPPKLAKAESVPNED